MKRIQERMERIHEHMERIRPEMEKMRDSLMEKHHESLRVLDSIDIPAIIREMDIEKHLRHGMRHIPEFIFEEDPCEDADINSKIEYKDGKVIMIRRDEHKKVKKVIIMNSDGETLEVMEGEEAREFIADEGGFAGVTNIAHEMPG
jgi:hypothetical protein